MAVLALSTLPAYPAGGAVTATAGSRAFAAFTEITTVTSQRSHAMLPAAAGAAGISAGTVAVAAGDFDGDGRNDVARTTADGSAAVWFGRADRGTDRVAVDVTGLSSAGLSVAALDSDGDGVEELLWWSANGASPGQLWHRRGGRSWAVERVATVPPSTRAVVADVNGDGRDDVLWHGTEAIAAIDRARPGGGFERIEFWPEPGLVPLAADFDGDAAEDVLWYEQASGRGVLWWGGATISAAPFDIGSGATLRPGQWDGTGGTDLLVGGPNGDVELDGHADRLFTASIVPVGVVPATVVGDVNGDGRSDLLELSGATGAWNNDSSGWLWEPWAPPAVPSGMLGDGTPGMIVADFDGDGTGDAAAFAPDTVPGDAPWDLLWQWGGRREQIFREVNPYAPDGLIVRMLGITAGRRVDPPLVSVTDACGAGWPVHAAVGDLVQAMLSDAAAQGVALCLNFGYRSYGEQASLRARRCADVGVPGNLACIYDWPSGPWPFTGAFQIARPGYSRHQIGVALDIGDTAGYATPAVVAWLSAHAHRYGFYNLGDRQRVGPAWSWGAGGEPWHVSIDGR